MAGVVCSDDIPELFGFKGIRNVVHASAGRGAVQSWQCQGCVITTLSDPSACCTLTIPKYRVFSKMLLISDMFSLRGIDSLNSSLLALTIRV